MPLDLAKNIPLLEFEKTLKLCIIYWPFRLRSVFITVPENPLSRPINCHFCIYFYGARISMNSMLFQKSRKSFQSCLSSNKTLLILIIIFSLPGLRAPIMKKCTINARNASYGLCRNALALHFCSKKQFEVNLCDEKGSILPDTSSEAKINYAEAAKSDKMWIRSMVRMNLLPA